MLAGTGAESPGNHPPKVPIVVFAFNRPELLQKLLAAVGQYHPPLLIGVLDGPRQGVALDEPQVRACKELFENFSGATEVELLTAEKNLGLPARFTSGLN
jgi:hypothetical protein